ncbi:MAG: hypothetical protein AABW45_01195 [Nanoarchaeota archaeon]
MHKILIDLDVLTVAFWKGDKKELALKFLSRVKNEEFILVTPFSLVNLILEWNDKLLAEKIKDFYFEYSNHILSNVEILKLTNRKGIGEEKIVNELESLGVKKEDSVLVFVASLFNIDYLITFNRKHLKNNRDKINEVLKKNGLRTIKIVEPNEI